MWLILKMFEMFISQGQSRSHLLKKPGQGLPDSGGSVSGSGCCTSHLCGTSSGWSSAEHLQISLECSMVVLAVGTAGCGLGVAGATGAVAGAAGAGLTGNNPGEDSGVAGAMSVLTGMSGLTASGWWSWMWSCAHWYWPPPMTWTK